jgi:hypothetical protein
MTAIAGPRVQMPGGGGNPLVDVSDNRAHNDTDWIAFFSVLQMVAFASTRSGTTAQRPTSATAGRWIGMPYFDTSLGKPIWLKSINTDVWVDATGGAV